MANKFWFNDEERKLQIVDYKEINFQLKYGNLLIGTLSYIDNYWKFEYSEDFKLQHKISPLVNFPQKDKIYQAEALWPFFAARIPSNAQLVISDKERETDLVKMLKNYGNRTITNPFELQATF